MVVQAMPAPPLSSVSAVNELRRYSAPRSYGAEWWRQVTWRAVRSTDGSRRTRDLLDRLGIVVDAPHPFNFSLQQRFYVFDVS